MEGIAAVLAVMLVAACIAVVVLARRGPTERVVPGPVRVEYRDRLVPGPVRVEYRDRDVPGPERIVWREREVPGPVRVEYRDREVPGPERIVWRNPPQGRTPAPAGPGPGPTPPPAEPVGFSGGRRPVADSEVDGASLGVVTVRAASVRGDAARRRGEARRDAFLLDALADEQHADATAVLTIVARGPETADGTGHQLAVTACRSLRLRLRASSKAIGRAWLDGDTAALVDYLRTAGRRVAETVAGEAGAAVPGLQLGCLLTQTGDRTARRHLFVDFGGVDVVAEKGGSWVELGDAAASHTSGPDDPRAVQFDTHSGDLVVMLPAAVRALLASEAGAALFAEGWQEPPDMPGFLWLLSARTGDDDADRTAICLWDRGRTHPVSATAS